MGSIPIWRVFFWWSRAPARSVVEPLFSMTTSRSRQHNQIMWEQPIQYLFSSVLFLTNVITAHVWWCQWQWQWYSTYALESNLFGRAHQYYHCTCGGAEDYLHTRYFFLWQLPRTRTTTTKSVVAVIFLEFYTVFGWTHICNTKYTVLSIANPIPSPQLSFFSHLLTCDSSTLPPSTFLNRRQSQKNCITITAQFTVDVLPDLYPPYTKSTAYNHSHFLLHCLYITIQCLNIFSIFSFTLSHP